MNQRRHGSAVRRLSAARSRGEHAVSDCARPLRNVPVAAAGLLDGEGLPGFVEQEFRDFLYCGWLAGGFTRPRCTPCRRERLVAFSYKGCRFCPSCGVRRMTERAAHLVDYVLPDVPVRQWVLTFPHRLWYRLAWDHDGCRAVTRLFVRTVVGFLRRRLCDRGSLAAAAARWWSCSALAGHSI
jgi:hypothetical protein